MPFVLTNAHVPQCLHGGAVTKTPAPKLVVGGQPVLTSVGPVTSCPLTPPPTGVIKCTTVVVAPAGLATKLKVGTPLMPVLISPLAATATAPPANPGGALSIPVATPTKLNTV